MSDLVISKNIQMDVVFTEERKPLQTLKECKDCYREPIDYNIGWPGVPYDNWEPTEATVASHDAKWIRGWCHVQNNSDIPLRIRTAEAYWAREWVGNYLLVVDGTAPDGSKLHLVTDFPLTRGCTDFKVSLVKTFDEQMQKETYALKAEWENGYREMYDAKKRERNKNKLPQNQVEKTSLRRLAQLSQRG